MAPRLPELFIPRRDRLAAENKPDAGKACEQIHQLQAIALINLRTGHRQPNAPAARMLDRHGKGRKGQRSAEIEDGRKFLSWATTKATKT